MAAPKWFIIQKVGMQVSKVYLQMLSNGTPTWVVNPKNATEFSNRAALKAIHELMRTEPDHYAVIPRGATHGEK